MQADLDPILLLWLLSIAVMEHSEQKYLGREGFQTVFVCLFVCLFCCFPFACLSRPARFSYSWVRGGPQTCKEMGLEEKEERMTKKGAYQGLRLLG